MLPGVEDVGSGGSCDARRGCISLLLIQGMLGTLVREKWVRGGGCMEWRMGAVRPRREGTGVKGWLWVGVRTMDPGSQERRQGVGTNVNSGIDMGLE